MNTLQEAALSLLGRRWQIHGHWVTYCLWDLLTWTTSRRNQAYCCSAPNQQEEQTMAYLQHCDYLFSIAVPKLVGWRSLFLRYLAFQRHFKTTTLRSCHSHGHTRTTVIDSNFNSLFGGLEPFLLPSILSVLSPYFTFIPKSSLSVHYPQEMTHLGVRQEAKGFLCDLLTWLAGQGWPWSSSAKKTCSS